MEVRYPPRILRISRPFSVSYSLKSNIAYDRTSCSTVGRISVQFDSADTVNGNRLMIWSGTATVVGRCFSTAPQSSRPSSHSNAYRSEPGVQHSSINGSTIG
ncbi:hypothetical protein OGAPHI_005578 [Ogataea philodendri]|uniref:Uncharacterized protein n=1 Tax=Ogataea philodendri TaxID=1378263 RepID=A0A9P8NZA9_9ASCO|nr:uncharacterized protein OGAPHI_005578 [Ogataea philodendri]KAH3662327.1 hypothetical protein OGAPHI_005578 [Ogataea philodendri]